MVYCDINNVENRLNLLTFYNLLLFGNCVDAPVIYYYYQYYYRLSFSKGEISKDYCSNGAHLSYLGKIERGFKNWKIGSSEFRLSLSEPNSELKLVPCLTTLRLLSEYKIFPNCFVVVIILCTFFIVQRQNTERVQSMSAESSTVYCILYTMYCAMCPVYSTLDATFTRHA